MTMAWFSRPKTMDKGSNAFLEAASKKNEFRLKFESSVDPTSSLSPTIAHLGTLTTTLKPQYPSWTLMRWVEIGWACGPSSWTYIVIQILRYCGWGGLPPCCFKNEHLKDTSSIEIGLCAQNIHNDLAWIVKTMGKPMCSLKGENKYPFELLV